MTSLTRLWEPRMSAAGLARAFVAAQKNPASEVSADGVKTKNPEKEPIMTSITDEDIVNNPLLCDEPHCMHFGQDYHDDHPDDLFHTAVDVRGEGWVVEVESNLTNPTWTLYATINYQQSEEIREEDIELFLAALRSARVVEATLRKVGESEGPNERRRYQLAHPELFDAQSAEVSS